MAFIFLLPVTAAAARPEPRHTCVDFQGALADSDELASKLDDLALVAAIHDDQKKRDLLKHAAQYIRITGRLLAMSSWAKQGCK